MVNIFGHEVFGKKPDPQIESMDSRIERLTKEHLIVDMRYEKKITGANSFLRVMYNRKYHIVDRLECLDWVITDFCAPTAEGADNKFLMRKISAWSDLFSIWEYEKAAFEAGIFIHEVPFGSREYFRRYSDLEFAGRVDYIRYGKKIWGWTWQAKHVGVQWAAFLNMMPQQNQFDNSPRQQDASIDLMGAAQKQREKRKEFAVQQPQTSSTS